MITSNVGLLEIPHQVAPVSAEGLNAAMETRLFPDVAPFPITFIPGVRNRREVVTLQDNLGQQDMMRGEETEALGLFSLIGRREPCLLVLPGSHNKIIAMDASGAILGCMTSISGEVLDALTFHTILSEAVEHRFVAPGNYDPRDGAGGSEGIRPRLGPRGFYGAYYAYLRRIQANQAANFILGVTMGMDMQTMISYIEALKLDAPTVYVAGKEPVNVAFKDVLEKLGGHEAVLVSKGDQRENGRGGRVGGV